MKQVSFGVGAAGCVLLLTLVGLVAPATSAAQIDSVAQAPLARYPVASGQDITVADKLFDELLSPFCPGLTLKNCPSPAADSLRRSIRANLDQGASIGDVKAALVDAYGETILGAPPATGFNIVLWVLPWVSVAVAGAGLAFLILRKRRRERPAIPGAPLPAATSDEERRLAAVMRDIA